MESNTPRKTKIIATLGPATESAEMVARLMDASVNVFRLNMSHAPHDWVRRLVKDIRAAATARRIHIGIMMDTQGPAIRTGDIGVPLDLQPGQKFTLTVRGERSEEERSVDVNYVGWLRPRHSKIYALCPGNEVAGGLTLSWGVTPFVVPFDLINPENTIEAALKSLVEQGRLKSGATIVIIGSILVGEQIVDAVQMRMV